MEATSVRSRQSSRSRTVADQPPGTKIGGSGPAFAFVDNRAEAVAQRKLQASIDSSPYMQRKIIQRAVRPGLPPRSKVISTRHGKVGIILRELPERRVYEVQFQTVAEPPIFYTAFVPYAELDLVNVGAAAPARPASFVAGEGMEIAPGGGDGSLVAEETMAAAAERGSSSAMAEEEVTPAAVALSEARLISSWAESASAGDFNLIRGVRNGIFTSLRNNQGQLLDTLSTGQLGPLLRNLRDFDRIVGTLSAAIAGRFARADELSVTIYRTIVRAAPPAMGEVICDLLPSSATFSEEFALAWNNVAGQTILRFSVPVTYRMIMLSLPVDLPAGIGMLLLNQAQREVTIAPTRYLVVDVAQTTRGLFVDVEPEPLAVEPILEDIGAREAAARAREEEAARYLSLDELIELHGAASIPDADAVRGNPQALVGRTLEGMFDDRRIVRWDPDRGKYEIEKVGGLFG